MSLLWSLLVSSWQHFLKFNNEILKKVLNLQRHQRNKNVFVMSSCQWGCSGGYSCSWIFCNIYLSIIFFIWYTVRFTIKQTKGVRPINTRSTKLQDRQRSPELALEVWAFIYQKIYFFQRNKTTESAVAVEVGGNRLEGVGQNLERGGRS